MKRNYKNYIIPIILTSLLFVVGVWATTVISDTGITTDEVNNIEYVTTMTGSAIQTAIDNCDSQCVIHLSPGRYTNVALTLRDNVTILGAGAGKGTNPITELKGDGTNPVISYDTVSATENSHLTQSITLRDLVIIGNSANVAMNLTNGDIQRLQNLVVKDASTCISLDYIGTEPPSGSTIPGGFWIQDSGILCSEVGINLNKQTQGWITNNWFPAGSASSKAHIVVNQSNKVRITFNEFNPTVAGGSGLYFADTADVKTADIFCYGNYHEETPGIAFNFTEFGNNADSKRIEVKLSMLNKTGLFKFLQIRPKDDYTDIALLAVTPEESNLYLIPKDLLKGLKPQHSGARGAKDTFYLGIRPIDLFNSYKSFIV